MASTLIEAPIEISKMAALAAAANGGRLARRLGEGIAHQVQSGYIPPEVAARQEVLKQFEGKLGVVDLIDMSGSDGDMEDRAYAAADALVDGKVVDQHSILEYRPVLPEDTLRDPAVNQRRERALHFLKLAFEEDHNVMVAAVPYSHPIMPSEHEDSPIDIEDTWKAFAPELDGLAHQFRADRRYNPAMLAMTSPVYARTMFGGHIAVEGEPEEGSLLVLESVGKLPEDNRLVRLN